MCEVLQVSRSGYYSLLPLRESLKEKQNELNSAVLESWIDSHKLYGSRRIAKDVKSEREVSLSKNTVFLYNEASSYSFFLSEEKVQEALQERRDHILSF